MVSTEPCWHKENVAAMQGGRSRLCFYHISARYAVVVFDVYHGTVDVPQRLYCNSSAVALDKYK